jgi:hypothetical protein
VNVSVGSGSVHSEQPRATCGGPGLSGHMHESLGEMAMNIPKQPHLILRISACVPSTIVWLYLSWFALKVLQGRGMDSHVTFGGAIVEFFQLIPIWSALIGCVLASMMTLLSVLGAVRLRWQVALFFVGMFLLLLMAGS